MKRQIAVIVAIAGAVVGVRSGAGAPPQIARIQGGNTKLVFGVGFAPGHAQVFGWDPTFKEDEVLKAIEADPYRGSALLPKAPPKGSRRLKILDTDARGLVMAVAFYDHYHAGGFYDATAGAQVCWVKNGDGFSKPWLVRSAKAWWVHPDRARPGSVVRIFGRNLFPGRRRRNLVALKPRSGGRMVVLDKFAHVRHPVYESAVWLPPDLAPGPYDLYVHNRAGGPAGWSSPLSLHVVRAVPSERKTIDARALGAKGDGMHDDTAALRRALASAAKVGAVVLLGPGRYSITGTLGVPDGVSLVGAGAGNTTIEVADARPMRGDFPDKAELQGYARDWLPHLKGHGYPPMVWLRHKSTLADLTLRSGPGVGLGVLVARCPGVGEDIRIERCTFRILCATHNWPASVPILLAGNTERLVIRDCDLVGHGGIDTIATSHRHAYVGHNTVRCEPHGQYNNLMFRGLVNSVIENNVVRDGKRNFVAQLGHKLGKHEVPEGRQTVPSASFYHTILLGNMFTNSIPRRHNDGETMYEAGGAFWAGRAKQIDATRITVDGKPFWTDMRDTYVLVLDGRGLGQYRRVVNHTANSLTVTPAWDVVPDRRSLLTVNGFFAETLWIDNTEEHTANWTGFWGNNVGHVIDGHILRDGAGIYLWGWSADKLTPVAFNDIIGSRVVGRGNIRLLGKLVFANTVRFCEVVDFRVRPGFHIQPYWLMNYDPAARAGIHLTATAHKIPDLPKTAPLKAWNVVEGTHIYDGPVGIHAEPDTRHLILRHNAIHVDGARVKAPPGAVVAE